MENKVTKRDVITMMLATEEIAKNNLFVSYLEHELELLDNKKASRKTSKTQLENMKLKDELFKDMANLNHPIQAMEMVKLDSNMYPSPQKVVSLLSILIKENKVVRYVEKNKTLFAIVA